jgi:serine/threonine protein kinase
MQPNAPCLAMIPRAFRDCFVVAAVRYLHSKRIAHCDISAENTMVVRSTEGVELKVIDFGMAAPIDDAGNSEDLRLRNVFAGKPYYTGPEVRSRYAEPANQPPDLPAFHPSTCICLVTWIAFHRLCKSTGSLRGWD